MTIPTQNTANKSPIMGACIFLAAIVPAPTKPPIAGANGPDKRCTMGMMKQTKLTMNATDEAFNITSNDDQ